MELEALSGDAGRELLTALVGRDTLPGLVERQILEPAEGNPFFLEELVRSMVDAGALVAEGGGWRFDHAVDLQVPPTVEKVILARIDRLPPASYEAVVSASVIGRSFSLPLLQAVATGDDVRAALGELMRVDLVREGRRWPDPEYRFTHALIQETAYRTLVADDRSTLHRRAAAWLEQHHAGREADVAGLLAHHWLGAEDEDQAVRYLTVAGDQARQDYALDEAIAYYRELLPLLDRRGERQESALVLFKLALALHMSLRFAEANDTYQRAFVHWTPPPVPERVPQAHTAGRIELPSRRRRPTLGDRVAEHPALHAAVRPARGAVAGAHDRAVARRALGDRRRRPAIRLPSARGTHMVRRSAAHGTRRGVRHQAGAEP